MKCRVFKSNLQQADFQDAFNKSIFLIALLNCSELSMAEAAKGGDELASADASLSVRPDH